MTPPICTLVHPSIGFCRTWCVTGGANDAAVSFYLNPVNRPYGAIVELHRCEPKMVERQMASPEQHHVHTIDHKIAAQRRSQSTLTVPGGWLQYVGSPFYTESAPPVPLRPISASVPIYCKLSQQLSGRWCHCVYRPSVHPNPNLFTWLVYRCHFAVSNKLCCAIWLHGDARVKCS